MLCRSNVLTWVICIVSDKGASAGAACTEMAENLSSQEGNYWIKFLQTFRLLVQDFMFEDRVNCKDVRTIM